MPDTHAQYVHSGFDSAGETAGTLSPAPPSYPPQRGDGGGGAGSRPAPVVRLIAAVRHFVRGARAGATGIAAVAITVITVSASAFVSDSKWLVDQRDVLKSASDAAGIAATLELSRQLDNNPGISDADLAAILEPVAQRYVLINLMHLDADRYARAEQTLVVQVAVNRGQRTVDVAAEADLGGIFMSRVLPFMAESVVSERTRVESLIETATNPIEVVLAIDVSESMSKSLGANRRPIDRITPEVLMSASQEELLLWVELGYLWWLSEEDILSGELSLDDMEQQFLTRMEIVQVAASNLVDILGPSEDDKIAIGVVPWSNTVRLDEQASDRWERNDWARYPTRRVYGVPYRCGPNNQCQDPPPSTQTVASSPPELWQGCLDEHRTGSVGTFAQLPAADELLWPPSQSAFAQNFFVPLYRMSYECIAPPSPPDMRSQSCYMPPTSTKTYGNYPAQYPCVNAHQDPPQPIRPLSTDPEQVEQAIDALVPVGLGTYSSLGVLWAQRLLEHSWKDVWEGTNHPADAQDRDNEGLRKAIVLLTDGVDNYCGLADPACDNRDVGVPLRVACDVAKAAGSEIFVVTAMAPKFVPQDLADRLYACSSQSDNPDGTYVFVNNATPQALIASFAEIANQLRTVRRVY